MSSWINDAIIYQVNLRSLAAREPRNAIEAITENEPCLSPLAYVTQHLATIEELGCNVLYFLPPYPIGTLARKGIGSPYSSSNFMAVEPEYGSIDELKALVAAAHSRGLKVIIDITPNHTSRDHVWTKEHPEYYIRDDQGEMFYDFDWNDVAKLDYSCPGLREAMIEVYDFWLSILGKGAGGRPDGVDGFRLDMAHMISDLAFWDEAMRILRARHEGRDLLFLAECYGTDNNMNLFARGINAAYDDDFYKVCQYLYAVDAGGQSTVCEAEDAASNGDFADKLEAFRAGGIAGAMTRALMNYEALLAPGEGPWLARYTDNHDEGRGLHRFGPGACRAVNLLAFLSPHTLPFLLTGQEFGAINRPSIHERMGVCDKGPHLREGGVTPGVEFEGNLFARAWKERQDWYSFYRELVALRRATPALCRGSFRLIDVDESGDPASRAIVAFERELEGTLVRCAVNMGNEARAIGAADLFTGNAIYGTMGGAEIPAFSGVVVSETKGDSIR